MVPLGIVSSKAEILLILRLCCTLSAAILPCDFKILGNLIKSRLVLCRVLDRDPHILKIQSQGVSEAGSYISNATAA